MPRALAPLIAMSLTLPLAAAEPSTRTTYPESRTVDAADTLHGVSIRDPYRWLEDGSSPEVKAWMKAQDELTRARLAALPERDAIAARLRELFYVDSISAPIKRGGRVFYTRRHATKEKAVVYWKEGKGGAEKVLFDPNGWSADGSVSLGDWQVSWDGRKAAFQEKRNNSDEATLYVLDVESGKRSDVDVIAGAKYASASFTPSGDGFYYTWLPVDPKIPVADRPGFAEVRFHRLGQDPAKDEVVRERTGDPTSFLGAGLSKDGRFLQLVVSHGWTSNDVYFKDLKGAASDWTPLAVGIQAHFEVDTFGGRLFVKTDDGASRSRVFSVDPARPARKDWVEVVPERKDATLEAFSILGGHLVLSYLRNAASEVEIRALDGSGPRTLALPGIGSVGGPVGLPDDDEAYFSFQSFTTPVEIRSLSIRSGRTDLYARVKVPVDPAPYTVDQVFFPSKDGTRISMFVVRRKDLKKDGSARTLLYGYGGFLSSETPLFTASIFPWLERGGVYAVANLRGGGEYGEEWHRDGMLLKKQNVFDDFVAAGEYLIEKKITSPDRLVIRGGSNGGLLVGAALTQRPDLFRVALCGVPLLDMVRYHLFGSGKTWISEYGSADDAAQLKALYAYSPYHHVKAGAKYPATLLLSADSDDRVDPMHARKFAAALQAASTGGPVLLRIERNAGHGGADMLKSAVESRADEYAFALAQTPARN